MSTGKTKKKKTPQEAGRRLLLLLLLYLRLLLLIFQANIDPQRRGGWKGNEKKCKCKSETPQQLVDVTEQTYATCKSKNGLGS